MASICTPIQVQGRYFWKDGKRFLIRGVVYRLHGQDASDPLVDERLGHLTRDITLFKELGLNVLFIYSIDNSRNHDAAMRLLEEAGIYVLVSLPTSASITDNAGTTTTFRHYSSELLNDCFATIDCMSQYSNTLGLIVANGALSTIYSTSAAPMIKTVIRDVKKYMATALKTTGQRQLPIGYSASNSRLILRTTFDYFTAGERDETVDFFSYANFNWCGESTMHISGYNAELKTFAQSHIPIFFSQYGCNLGACGKRIFQETTAIYSPAMTNVFSGGIAYEFYDSSSIRSGQWGYGLVRVEEEAVVGANGLTKLPDYFTLKSRLEACDSSASTTTTPQPRADGGGYEALRSVVRDIPPLSPHWKAGYALPSIADWKGVQKNMDEKLWVEVDVQELGEEEFVTTHRQIIRA